MAFRLGVEEHVRSDGDTVKRWTTPGLTDDTPQYYVAQYDRNGEQIILLSTTDIVEAGRHWERLAA